MNGLPYLSFLETKVAAVESRMLAGADRYHPDLRSALKHILDSGGKRVRPQVALLMGEIFSAPEEKLISLGAAIEMLHTATLVHDDLIDGALLRRGNPTLNSNWSPAATVLTGDYIFARAALLAAEVGSSEVTCLFAETLITIVNGEISQLFNRGHSTDQSSYFQRIYEKTGSMFVLASRAAAILGTADEEQIDAAEDFGREIGKAFQIVDDILDFVGDPTQVGKPVGNDLRQGLITLPVLYFLEDHPEDQDLQFFLEGNQKADLIQSLVNKIVESGSVDKAQKQAEISAARAVEMLEEFPEREEKQALADLAGYIVDREY